MDDGKRFNEMLDRMDETQQLKSAFYKMKDQLTEARELIQGVMSGDNMTMGKSGEWHKRAKKFLEGE